MGNTKGDFNKELIYSKIDIIKNAKWKLDKNLNKKHKKYYLIPNRMVKL